jgi:hypothetical protein
MGDLKKMGDFEKKQKNKRNILLKNPHYFWGFLTLDFMFRTFYLDKNIFIYRRNF